MNTDGNAPHKRVSRQIEAQSRQQWQPIETVPKDGTEVIVVDVDGVRFIASSTDGHNLCDGFYPIDSPTHWMPLPEPPTCSHDYVNFKRKGRARYHCPKCDADITLECVLLAESLMEETENKTEQP